MQRYLGESRGEAGTICMFQYSGLPLSPTAQSDATRSWFNQNNANYDQLSNYPNSKASLKGSKNLSFRNLAPRPYIPPHAKERSSYAESLGSSGRDLERSLYGTTPGNSVYGSVASDGFTAAGSRSHGASTGRGQLEEYTKGDGCFAFVYVYMYIMHELFCMF